MQSSAFANLIYLIAAALFIFGLKKMAHPRTAVLGNLLGASGMTLAILVGLAVVVTGGNGLLLVVAGLIIGAAIGAALAQTIPMTSMPQLVALFNGFGGAASVFVAGGALMQAKSPSWDVLLATGLSGVIGAVTFSGSLVAFGKLQELKIFRKQLTIPGQPMVNLGLAVVVVLFVIGLTWGGYGWVYIPITILALAMGVFLTTSIGGADMPVVIALLNSYSGLAAAATGFVIDNNVLIISGSLVGASGVILTQLMCKAMNRSLTNVLFGVMDGGKSMGDADEIYSTVRSTTADDVAMILDSAQRVVFVPGYGMAVAQAQHAVRDLSNILESKGATVEYGIHPVAGRMPGHMNVLLAEADVSYDKLKEMDDINATLGAVDVAIVIGANDVVNPVARTDSDSPIFGMPIIDVDNARVVIVIKRSLSPGFAGIPNPLFAAENTLMLFGDGQKAVLDIVRAIKELS